MDRYGLIYLVTNLTNGKRYVGKTSQTLARRWIDHRNHAKRKLYRMALHGAIRKYGEDSFKIEQLCKAKESFLPELEKFFIKFLNTRIEKGCGYNMTDGGDGLPGHFPSKETRAKMSRALIGNKRKRDKKNRKIL